MSDAPKRNHQVTIVIGADGPEEVKRALRFLSTDFYMYGVRNTMTGGPDWGATVDVEVNPEITHESYFTAVDEWLKAQEGDK